MKLALNFRKIFTPRGDAERRWVGDPCEAKMKMEKKGEAKKRGGNAAPTPTKTHTTQKRKAE
jgi:hypothetical protein